MSTGLEQRGDAQRVLARLYERLGSRRLLVVCIVGGSIVAAVTVIVIFAWIARYLHASVGELARWVAIGEGLMLVGLATGLFWSKATLRTVAVWSDVAGTPARALDTWPAIERGPLIVTSRVCASILILECAVEPAIIVTDRGAHAYVVGLVIIAVLAAVGAAGLFVVFAIDMAFRPMLEDVASHLPRMFAPTTRAWRLRTKAIAPIPAVTLFTALTVGAFSDVARNGSQRFAIVVGVALVAVAVATAILSVITRSTLDPLDELTAATRRVRDGDLTTDAKLLTTDDLGELTHSFNEMLGGLREREALRVHNVELVTELQASRARIVASADAERRRVERDLHDGAQQHLVLLGLKLGVAQRSLQKDPPTADAALAELRADLDRALAELRDLAHGIYPQLLESEGLPGALREAVQRSALPAGLECDGAHRYPPELEAAVYFCCLEALQNAAKHAGDGAEATVRLVERDAALEFEIADTGAGFELATCQSSAGLQNMTDRIGALGGKLKILSAPGHGTKIIGTVPLPG